MTTRFVRLSLRDLSTAAARVVLTAVLTTLPLAAQSITLVTERSALGGNDQLDWSSLGPTKPFNFLPNSFSATSQGGLGLQVDIPFAGPEFTPPLVFQTLPPPRGIPTNFASGDFLLFTGFIQTTFPAIGNPGPITITFDTPVQGAGTQIAVDDTEQFTTFISAFDESNMLLGTFQAAGTSSLKLDNSAIFLGVSSDTANISRIEYRTSVPNRAVAINTLSLVDESVAVPEPTSVLGVLAFGTLGAGLALKRKLKPNKL